MFQVFKRAIRSSFPSEFSIMSFHLYELRISKIRLPRWTIKNFRNEAPGNLEIWELGEAFLQFYSKGFGREMFPKSVLPPWESRFSGVAVTIFGKCQRVFAGLRRRAVGFGSSEISIKWWFQKTGLLIKDWWNTPFLGQNPHCLVDL